MIIPPHLIAGEIARGSLRMVGAGTTAAVWHGARKRTRTKRGVSGFGALSESQKADLEAEARRAWDAVAGEGTYSTGVVSRLLGSSGAPQRAFNSYLARFITWRQAALRRDLDDLADQGKVPKYAARGALWASVRSTGGFRSVDEWASKNNADQRLVRSAVLLHENLSSGWGAKSGGVNEYVPNPVQRAQHVAMAAFDDRTVDEASAWGLFGETLRSGVTFGAEASDILTGQRGTLTAAGDRMADYMDRYTVGGEPSPWDDVSRWVKVAGWGAAGIGALLVIGALTR